MSGSVEQVYFHKTKGDSMTTNEIKKGMRVRTTQLGVPVTGVMEDNKKGQYKTDLHQRLRSRTI